MPTRISRRSLAIYAAGELTRGQSPSKLARQLAAVLIENNMLPQADLLASDIAAELERRGLLAQAVVTSTHELSATLKNRLEKYVQRAAKVKQVSLSCQIDKSLLGGVRIETAARTWDKTVSRKLSEIKGGI